MGNVGSTDRMVRLILGVVLLVAGLLPLFGVTLVAGLGVWQWALVVVGAVLVGTALMRTCPAYSLLGVSTNKRTSTSH